MIETVLMLALVGFILWLILTFIPMPPVIKSVIIVFVVVVIVVWLLRGGIGGIHMGKLN